MERKKDEKEKPPASRVAPALGFMLLILEH
jgi:hypothetical protein